MKLAIFFFVALLSFASAQIFQQPYRRPTTRPVYTYSNLNSARYNNDGRYSGGDDGQYHPDDSGAYRPDGSGGYQHQDGGYKHQDAGYKHQDAGYRHQGDRFGGDGSGGPYQGGSGSYTPSSSGGSYNGGTSGGVRGVGVGTGSGVGGIGGSGAANRFQGSNAGANSGLKQGNAAGLYDNRNYAIIRKVEHVEEDGYHYLYETENGILGEEEGHLQNKGAENEAMHAKGFFTYTGPDSIVYTVEYTADDNGFVPAAAHLPTPPPVPVAIIKSLEYQRSIGELKD